MNVAVIGAGAWGTALAQVLVSNGHPPILWAHQPEVLEIIRRKQENERYLPGVTLSPALQLEPDLGKATAAAEVAVIAVPSHAFREVTGAMRAFDGVCVSVTKGIEFDTGKTMCGILEETAPRAQTAALSGPTLAREVAQGIPTAMVAASRDPEVAELVQALFHRPTFRVYTSADVTGVELGGALKNVIAIAAGVCDGLGFGDNSKAALITRGITEVRRLGVACGAQPETFSGLSGLGDLCVTCISRLSRNRTFGERLGKGEKVSQILATSVAVAEGYPTSRSAHQLAQRLEIETPIIEEVYRMCHEGKDVGEAVRDLISRETRAE
jgi:glycerol-3-phosphate dehydrogenase (NAD(P)+)